MGTGDLETCFAWDLKRNRMMSYEKGVKEFGMMRILRGWRMQSGGGKQRERKEGSNTTASLGFKRDAGVTSEAVKVSERKCGVGQLAGSLTGTPLDSWTASDLLSPLGSSPRHAAVHQGGSPHGPHQNRGPLIVCFTPAQATIQSVLGLLGDLLLAGSEKELGIEQR